MGDGRDSRRSGGASSHAGAPPEHGITPGDLALALALFAGVVAYLWRLPRFLGGDEGYFLFAAKRLLAGEVFYRDVFDLITPGAHYLMAGLFALFGTDMATARGADAVVHGAIVVTVYALCRMLGVGRGVAAGAALLHPAFFQSAWQCASPHWIATLIALLVCAALLADGRRAPVLAGMLTGLLIAVQQQKGFVFVVGVPVILLAEEPWARHDAKCGGVRRVIGFLAGLGLVVVPVGTLLVVRAGLEPVANALIVHPLVNYRRFNRAPWGATHAFPSYTFPGLLGYLPVLAALTGLRALTAGRAANDRRRKSIVLTLFALVSLASIAYYPDYIHLAFVGSVFAVLLADLVQWALERLGGRVRLVVASLLLAAAGAQMGRVLVRSQHDFPVAHASPFGTVSFHTEAEAAVYDRVWAHVQATGSPEMFVYPWGGGPHLLTGTSNPTRYQLLVNGYSSADQLREVIETLERRQVPLALLLTPPVPDDPVIEYLLRHYRAIEEDGRPLPLMRRLPAGAEAPEDGPGGGAP